MIHRPSSPTPYVPIKQPAIVKHTYAKPASAFTLRRNHSCCWHEDSTLRAPATWGPQNALPHSHLGTGRAACQGNRLAATQRRPHKVYGARRYCTVLSHPRQRPNYIPAAADASLRTLPSGVRAMDSDQRMARSRATLTRTGATPEQHVRFRASHSSTERGKLRSYP